MLVGGDLGFPYLVLGLVLLAPVVGLFVRRKLRLAAARDEEIRRLVVLASEEAARAELEAMAGYSSAAAVAPLSVSSFKPPYQCQVCFSPTTTRCAKCKAVHYCSGKCQIIHWRQGHKDECRPFISTQKINNVDGGLGDKICSQGDKKHYDNVFETERRQIIKPVERSSEEPMLGSSVQFDGLQQKEAVDFPAHVKDTDSTFKSNLQSPYEGSSTISKPCGLQPADAITDNIAKKSFLGQAALIDSSKSFSCSAKFNQDKTNSSDEDTQSGHSSSSGWTVHGSRESLFSDHSTSSSGFCEGTTLPKKSRIDVHDDSAPSSSTEVANEDMLDSRSAFGFSFHMAKSAVDSLEVQGSSSDSSISDGTAPNTLGIKTPVDKATPAEEIFYKNLNSSRSATYTSGVSKHRDMNVGSDSRKSMSGEAKIGATAPPHHSSDSGGYSHKDAKIFNGVTSSGPEKSVRMFNSKLVTSDPVKSLEIGASLSRTSDAQLASITSRHLSQSTKSVKLDDVNHRVAGCSAKCAEKSQNSRNGLKTSMLKVVDQLKSSKLSRHNSLAPGSELAGRYGCKKGLFPYEDFVKLYNWKNVELIPCGFINCGNSCYANVVLQCLAFTPPLTAYLLQGLHSKTCDKREWCFTCEFESLILKAKDGRSPLSPIRIFSQIQSIGSHLHNGREEDAHEFLRYAIDTLQSVCLKEAMANVTGPLEEETSLIGLTFGGYLQSKIKCMKCGGKSERHERMMDLTVEIEGNIRTLEEALYKFTSIEILDGENKYMCTRCKAYQKAKKKLTVLEAPNVLTIALKRFQSGKFGKLNKPIHFPEILDLAPYVSGTSDKSLLYRLYGVVVHLDVMNAAFSGHYVCYVKNVQDKWFKVDDSMVKETELQNVLTKGAYMLLYARCSPCAPRAIRSTLIPPDPRKQRNQSFKSNHQSTEPWVISRHHLNDHLSSQQHVRRNLEEDSSSDNSSAIFSESCSCSTESSNRDSSSNDDHMFGDMERDIIGNISWMANSSDSDTSSSASSSPSPLFSSKHSPLADVNRYARGSQVDDEESDVARFTRARSSSSSCLEEHKGGVISNSSDVSTKECRKLDCSNSCRETNSSDRLGSWTNPLKDSGVSLRRSMRERSD